MFSVSSIVPAFGEELHSMSSVMPFSGSFASPSLGFRRHCPLSDREMLEVVAFILSLSCIWAEGTSVYGLPIGGFFCTSFSRSCVPLSLPDASSFSHIWKVKIAKKVKFFTWQVLHGRVNTSIVF